MTDAQFPPGWYDDPVGRGEQRYYDGAAWTDQIRVGGIDRRDPLDGSGPTESFDDDTDATVIMSVPTAAANASWAGAPQPAGGASAPSAVAAATSANQASSFLESLGTHARDRENPEFPLALGGVGGLLVGIGLVALIGQSASRGAILGGGAVALALALIAALKLLGDQPWLRTAATACGSVGLFAIAGALVLGGGDISDNAPGLFLTLAGALHLAAWIAPGFRGRPLMLGGGIFATSFGLALLVAGGECEPNFNSFDGGCNFAEEAASQFGLSTGAGIVMIFIGAALLFGVRKLDTDGYRGIASTVAAAAIVTLLFGAAALSIDLGSTGNSLFVIVVGLGLGIVGHMGMRRALTWTGAALVAAGVVSLAANLITTDDATTGAMVLILLGALLIGVPRLIQVQGRAKAAA